MSVILYGKRVLTLILSIIHTSLCLPRSQISYAVKRISFHLNYFLTEHFLTLSAVICTKCTNGCFLFWWWSDRAGTLWIIWQLVCWLHTDLIRRMSFLLRHISFLTSRSNHEITLSYKRLDIFRRHEPAHYTTWFFKAPKQSKKVAYK